MLVMPVWSKPELDLCHQRLYSTLDTQRMDGLYAKYGGVPRYVLEHPSLHPSHFDLQVLQQAVDTCDPAQVMNN